jgi:AraC-like DNA-binding protein/ligand-binding sensor protein
MATTSIIQRRDLEPLWHKANEIIWHYEKAADCITAVIGADCISAKLSEHPKSGIFCALCKRFSENASALKPGETPCTPMHRSAAINARKSGGSCIYTCPMGFYFWTSSFFVGERFAGAFISSVMPKSGQQQIIDRLYTACKKEISRAEIAELLNGVPERTDEEVKTLACMMKLCAEQITRFGCRRDKPEDEGQYHDGQKPLNIQGDVMDMERLLIASLRRGDSEETRKITGNLLNALYTASGENFKIYKYKVIELIVVLSRAGENPGNNEELVESTSRYLKRLDEAKTAGEVNSNVHAIVERIAGKIFSFQGIRHAAALRKAERFIRENLNRKISLNEISGVSGLSAPYFSTIFKEEIGENLSNYLNRLRIEKASAMLRETDLTVGEISVACGFKDQSWFSRIFKSCIGVSPCKYREAGWTSFHENETKQEALQ